MQLLNQALDVLTGAADFDALLGLHVDAVVEFAQDFERVRNRMAVLDHAIIAAFDDARVADILALKCTSTALSHLLRLDKRETNARVRAAVALSPRVAVTGQPLEPLLPRTALAQRRGELNPGQCAVIDHVMTDLSYAPDVAMEELDTAELFMVTEATSYAVPADLRTIGEKLQDTLDPDGSPGRDKARQQRRHLNISDSGRLTGEVTGDLQVKIHAVLGPLAKPRPADASGRDDRSHGQRMHDALLALCERFLRSGTLPDSGGTPATAIVTMRYEDLIDRCGYAESTTGARVPVTDLLRKAADLRIIPAMLDTNGAILHLGESTRLATEAQTYALIARDGGCSFPACDIPAEWCERHHTSPWRAQRRTHINELTLLCGYHHDEFELRGWECVMTGGLPRWRPPGWIDPDRRPILHTRIAAMHTLRRE